MKHRNYIDEDIIKAVKNNTSMAKTLIELGLSPKGGNHTTIKKAIKRLSLDSSHFTGQSHLKGKTHNWAKKIPLKEILVKDSTYNNNRTLKKQLFEKGLLENKCQLCGLESEWKGKPIVLRLDHINGTNSDNRLENLRMVCPNCDSQLDTFAGRNTTNSLKIGERINIEDKPKIENKYTKKKNCSVCISIIADSNKSGLCLSCSQRKRVGRINRPKKELLIKEVKESGYSAVGRKYGVSDNAIRKWLK